MRATNRKGDWSGQYLSIPVFVKPDWYQTWWFQALILLALGLFFWFGYLYRIRRLQQFKRQLEEEVRARTADLLLLGDIGKELATVQNIEAMVQRVYTHLKQNMAVDAFLVGILDEARRCIHCPRVIESGKTMPPVDFLLDDPNRPASWCVREGRELVIRKEEDWAEYGLAVPRVVAGVRTVSLIYLPLRIKERVLGCLSVQSTGVWAYRSRQIEIIRILASYTAVALDNALAYQRLAEAQQQLVLEEKMASLGTLTAGVAHEINNPVNFIQVGARHLEKSLAEFHHFLRRLVGEDPDEEILASFEQRFQRFAEMITTIDNGAERIQGIVKDLRIFTRLDEAERKRIHIADSLQATVHLLQGRYPGLSIQTRLGFNPEIECYPANLNQVFLNLIENAYQATRERAADASDSCRGTLEIETEPDEEDGVQIHFRDNGSGMDRETSEHIFEPFFTTREVGKGTGLGLAIVYGVIRDHGGRIDLASEPGEGTRVTLHLPYRPDSERELS